MADTPHENPAASKKADQPPKDFMGMLEYYLVTKAPWQIPTNAREWIVQWGPWIEVVLLILALPVLLAAIGISAVLLPFASVAAPGIGLGLILVVGQIGLQAAALPGLFARKKQGWMLAFYAQILGFVVSLIGGNIVGALIGAVIGLYILFQIKSYYN